MSDKEMMRDVILSLMGGVKQALHDSEEQIKRSEMLKEHIKRNQLVLNLVVKEWNEKYPKEPLPILEEKKDG